MDIKIEMLRCFAEVARNGNLADAAARLGRSTSAVSMTLKQLQAQLGQPLFASDRKNELTPLGDFVLARAKDELDHFDQTRRSISAYIAGGAGVLRIGAVPSVAAFLPQAIADFVTRMPKARISLGDQDSEQVLRGLLDGDLDVGIATAPKQILRDFRTPLISDPYGIVCPKDHPLAQQSGPLQIGEISAFPFISNPLSIAIHTQGFAELSERATVHVTNTLSLLAMVSAGIGITILPELAVKTAASDLVFVSLEQKLGCRDLDLLFPQSKSLSPLQIGLAAALCHAVGKPERASKLR